MGKTQLKQKHESKRGNERAQVPAQPPASVLHPKPSRYNCAYCFKQAGTELHPVIPHDPELPVQIVDRLWISLTMCDWDFPWCLPSKEPVASEPGARRWVGSALPAIMKDVGEESGVKKKKDHRLGKIWLDK